ncbi:MAG: hypothetical protein ACOY32_04085 [Thermodesulfobacteriota bacterium]
MKKSFVLLLLITVISIAYPDSARAGGPTVDRTLEALGRVPGISAAELDHGKPFIEKMDYTSMRVVRALCGLADITPSEALRLLAITREENLGYDHLLLFERYCELEGVSVAIALAALEEIRGLGFTTVWAAASLFAVPGIGREQAMAGLAVLRKMRDPGRWAAKAYCETGDLSQPLLTQGLRRISAMSDHQSRATETACTIKDITAPQALTLMDDIIALDPWDVANARALLGLEEMTPETAHGWLTGYFRLPRPERDIAFLSLSPVDKKILLHTFFNASDHFVRMINDFHAVCHDSGAEISEGELRGSSFDRLNFLFSRLPDGARDKFTPSFTAALQKRDKSSVIYVLRDATAFARKYVATQLSTANIYTLMTRVSVLYDSSFRLILIPELQKRLAMLHEARLLAFLRATDPDNLYVANFISSLSLKGRLSLFFPADQIGQEHILELVATSAFQDENSLVLFAATFKKLLIAILPGSRDFIIGKMVAKADDSNIFAKLVRTTLQYYLEEQPGILGQENIARISSVLAKHEPVMLARYWHTPFAEWLRDGVLSSLSVFHGDDDGNTSFVANCALLTGKGYRGRVSLRFPEAGFGDQARLREILAAVNQRAGGSFARLFSFLRSSGLVIDFSRTVDGIEISHSVSVYQDAENQQRLLERFLRDDHEMFAHRGHSYWLNEHLLDPLHELREKKRIGKDEMAGKIRFLSIGACGGVNIYADLARVFCGTIDVLGSLGAGKTGINNLYNWFLLETVATSGAGKSWQEMDRRALPLFAEDPEKDYQLPGELPSLLYKVVGEERCWF